MEQQTRQDHRRPPAGGRRGSIPAVAVRKRERVPPVVQDAHPAAGPSRCCAGRWVSGLGSWLPNCVSFNPAIGRRESEKRYGKSVHSDRRGSDSAIRSCVEVDPKIVTLDFL